MALLQKGPKEEEALRFVDASVFVHAYLKPRRVLSVEEVAIKEDAKSIVTRVNTREPVTMTVIHLAEVANVLEENLPMEEAISITGAILSKENINVTEVTRQDCLVAQSEAVDAKVGLSDAIAFTVMRRSGVNEIYSFDRDFDRLQGIRRIRS